jgi:hypothetical protein
VARSIHAVGLHFYIAFTRQMVYTYAVNGQIIGRRIEPGAYCR